MKLAVLGNGQLGMMLQQAGMRIGVDVQLLDIEEGVLPTQDVLITAEREHWPNNPFTEALTAHNSWLNQAAFFALANRVRQKTMLDELKLPTAPWRAVTEATSQSILHDALGSDIFLKRATGGYDGRGQMRLKLGHASDFSDWAGDAVAEQAIPFETEVSIIGARNRDGYCVYYRLTENRHDQGVLSVSLSHPNRFAHIQNKAEKMLHTVMNALNYVGVMAMECFLLGDQLLVNEIAPRVHNSGHWTQSGATISQFELHVRAVCDLPMPQPVQMGHSMMINLLGVQYDTAWLKHGAAQLHWYGKEYRPGRKMGHVNFTHASPLQLAEWLQAFEMPAAYEDARQWAVLRLQSEPV